jgi:hypothetical protein
MSVLDFSEVLRNRALANWASKTPVATTTITASADKTVNNAIADYSINFKIDSANETERLATQTRIVNELKDPRLQRTLLDLHGSPSYMELVNDMLLDILKGRKTSKKYHTNEVVLSKIVVAENTQLEKLATNSNLEQAKAISTSSTQIKTLDGRFYSLASLQVLLNSQLQDVISANMGNGDQRRVLNFRTGRFASTVAVEKLTLGKEGMISIFYSYMKYPYATFSEGGVQGYPRTRDPKTLIGNSIKEIAATKVANRLRTVLI